MNNFKRTSPSAIFFSSTNSWIFYQHLCVCCVLFMCARRCCCYWHFVWKGSYRKTVSYHQYLLCCQVILSDVLWLIQHLFIRNATCCFDRYKKLERKQRKKQVKEEEEEDGKKTWQFERITNLVMLLKCHFSSWSLFLRLFLLAQVINISVECNVMRIFSTSRLSYMRIAFQVAEYVDYDLNWLQCPCVWNGKGNGTKAESWWWWLTGVRYNNRKIHAALNMKFNNSICYRFFIDVPSNSSESHAHTHTP